MDWMEVNGVALRYAVSGEGKENLVLVHELGGALESWSDVLPALEQEFRVLRYDQRGFGLSEKSKGTLDINDMTGDIAALTTGQPQPAFSSGFRLFRIGDAVASRGIAASIYEARRLCNLL